MGTLRRAAAPFAVTAERARCCARGSADSITPYGPYTTLVYWAVLHPTTGCSFFLSFFFLVMDLFYFCFLRATPASYIAKINSQILLSKIEKLSKRRGSQ
jgi:hypothetical protein